MGRSINEMIEFITWGRGKRYILTLVPDRPVNQQGTPDDIFLRDKPPVAAVQALITIIAQNKVISLWNNQLAVLD